MLIAPTLLLLATLACSTFAQQPPPRVVGYGSIPCTSFDANNNPQPSEANRNEPRCIT